LGDLIAGEQREGALAMWGPTAAALMLWFRHKGEQRAIQGMALVNQIIFVLHNEPTVTVAPIHRRRGVLTNLATRDPFQVGVWVRQGVPLYYIGITPQQLWTRYGIA
jgi:hypothetical protein